MIGALPRYAGDIPLAIEVLPSDRVRTAAHLAQYLPGPVGDQRMDGYRFTVHTEPAMARTALAEWAGQAERTLMPIPGVVLTETAQDSGRRRYTLLRDALENRPGAWAVQIDGTVIDLYTADAVRAPRYLLRLIREVMLRSYENSGGLVFHAAGAHLPGGAVMICGPGSAGKTTVLAGLLSATCGHAALLSNDRLIVVPRARPQAIAVPLPVPVARGTLEAFPALADRCEVPISALPRVFGTRDKTALPARVFATALGSGLAASSSLRSVIVPRLTDSAQRPRIQRLDPGRARRVLDESCFTPTDEFWSPWLLPRTRPDRELRNTARHACALLAETLTCHLVTFGVRRPVHTLTAALADLIGAL